MVVILVVIINELNRSKISIKPKTIILIIKYQFKFKGKTYRIREKNKYMSSSVVV